MIDKMISKRTNFVCEWWWMNWSINNFENTQFEKWEGSDEWVSGKDGIEESGRMTGGWRRAIKRWCDVTRIFALFVQWRSNFSTVFASLWRLLVNVTLFFSLSLFSSTAFCNKKSMYFCFFVFLFFFEFICQPKLLHLHYLLCKMIFSFSFFK